MILTFVVLRARAMISFCMLSKMPEYLLFPLDRAMLSYRSFWISTSHFMMELKVVLWMSQDSTPKKEDWISTSGHRNHWDSVVAIFCSKSKTM